MNEYTYTELEIGHTESFSRIITPEMMEQFAAMSGDCNPLHCDAAYAKAKGFPGRVVYGMLTASLYSALAGVYLPGKYCLLYQVDSLFRKPVYIGDTLSVRGKVSAKEDVFQMITISAQITNQKGEKVSKATIKAGFLA